MEETKILIRNVSQLVTCSGFKAKKGKEMSELGIIEDGAVAMSEGLITHVGTTEEVLKQLNKDEYLEVDGRKRSLLPGFVNTMNATRESSYDELYSLGYERLDEMMNMGVTFL